MTNRMRLTIDDFGRWLTSDIDGGFPTYEKRPRIVIITSWVLFPFRMTLSIAAKFLNAWVYTAVVYLLLLTYGWHGAYLEQLSQLTAQQLRDTVHLVTGLAIVGFGVFIGFGGGDWPELPDRLWQTRKMTQRQP